VKILSHANVIIPMIFFEVKKDNERISSYVMENHYLCQLDEKERIILASKISPLDVSKINVTWFNSGFEHTLSMCINYKDIETHVKNWYNKASEDRYNDAKKEGGYVKKFLTTELNRIFLGGIFNKYNMPKGGKISKDYFLLGIYDEIFGKDFSIIRKDGFFVKAEVDKNLNAVRILDERLKNIEKMLNLLIKKEKISIQKDNL
jgi:hypothetical protein